MAQGRVCNDVEGLTRCHVLFQLNRLGVDHDLFVTVRQLIPTLGLGAQVELGAGSFFKHPGDAKEVCGAPFFQLKLKFGNGF